MLDLKRELKEMGRTVERQEQQISRSSTKTTEIGAQIKCLVTCCTCTIPSLKRAADRFNLEEEVMGLR